MAAVLRTADVEWTGSIARRSGPVSGGSGAIADLSFIVAWRIGQLEGNTSPEELFAAAHTGTVPIYGQVALFALSVCIGFAFERTKRLGVAIGMHIAFNALNVALALYQR